MSASSNIFNVYSTVVLCVHKWLARLTTQRNLLSRIVFGIKTAEKLNPIHAAVTVDTLATMENSVQRNDFFFTSIKLLILCRVVPSNFPSIQHIHIYIQCIGISAIRGKKVNNEQLFCCDCPESWKLIQLYYHITELLHEYITVSTFS